jgi:hypothetical protein
MSGIKYDQEKPNMALLPAAPLESVAAVLTFGAKKYAAHNWRGGIAYSRLVAAALRHIFAFLRGENNDPESGLSHLSHAVCCLLFLLQFVLDGQTKLDDRYTPPQA